MNSLRLLARFGSASVAMQALVFLSYCLFSILIEFAPQVSIILAQLIVIPFAFALNGRVVFLAGRLAPGQFFLYCFGYFAVVVYQAVILYVFSSVLGVNHLIVALIGILTGGAAFFQFQRTIVFTVN